MKIFSHLFIFFGILWCLIGGYYLWMQYNPNRLSFQQYPVKKAESAQQSQKPTPIRVVISDVGIDLPLLQAKIENNIWETTHNGASYLSESTYPGDTGNSVIYGHNWANLFGNLTHVKPGHVVEIVYADNSKKKFVVEYTSTVLPSESSILNNSKDKRITLYTCVGFLDSKRFVVVAVYDENAKVARP